MTYRHGGDMRFIDRVPPPVVAASRRSERIAVQSLETTPAFHPANVAQHDQVMTHSVDLCLTKQSGDWGVDVVANFQFGITEITEVVQVKRTETVIGRPVIDQLRGALPYHRAIRGTIITLGKFARGVEESALFHGAAPITLIDGDRLLELVAKHEIGIQRKPAYLLEIDEAFFAVRTEDDEED